jgi:hypothetical protein
MNDAAGSSRPRDIGVEHGGVAHGAGTEHGVVLPKTAARQGVTGHNVRYVLIISTVAAIVGLTIAYYYVFP